MIKNHQTTIGILEKGVQERDSTRIQLLGPEALLEETKFKRLNTDDANTIAETHEVESYLFYTVERHTETEIVSVERGVGKLEKEGKAHFINRLLPISRGKTAENLLPSAQISDFEETRDTFLVIGTSAPSNINELLFLPHSVASTNAEGVQTTPIPENCLLGRREGDIEALDNTEVGEVLGNVSLKRITLAPSPVPTDPANGMMFFNENIREIQVYIDGEWRSL